METLSLADFRSVVFFTGAGMSAESGVPTYRGNGGVWGQYRWEDYACQRAFDANPVQVIGFHEERRARVLGCEPHAGHRHLARLQDAHPHVTVITQNTDGLHTRAGVRDVIELHGCIWRVRCGTHGVTEDRDAAAYRHRSCPACGTHLRPDIVWFGDVLDAALLDSAQARVASCDLFVSVGTSAVVWPAAAFIPLAKRCGAHMVEINPEPSDLSGLFDRHWRGPAGQLIPQRFPLP